MENSLKAKTISLWSYVNSEIDQFLNPFYVPSANVLMPSALLEDIIFWKSCYLRYQRRKASTLSKELRGKMLQNTVQNLTERIKELETSKSDMQKEFEKFRQV